MIKLNAFNPIFIGLAMSFKILGSTASRPIFLQLIALPINMGSINPILYHHHKGSSYIHTWNYTDSGFTISKTTLFSGCTFEVKYTFIGHAFAIGRIRHG
jgi:hypothetical protein